MGFIKFLKGWYIILISAKTKVAKIGRHNIFKVNNIHFVALFKSATVTKVDDEQRYV